MNNDKTTKIFLIVVIVFLILGYIVDTHRSEKRGYDDGYDSGYETGYDEGYEQALNDYGIDE